MAMLALLLGFVLAFGLAGFGSSGDSDSEEDETGRAFIGTEGDDTLTGTAGNDTLRGLEGDDLLLGLGGDDLLEGGPGNDTLDGGPDTNTLLGGEGDDVLILAQPFGSGSVFDGGPGTDRLDASDFDRRLTLEIGLTEGRVSYDVPNPDEPTDFEQVTGSIRDIEVFELPDAPNNDVQFAPGAPAVQIDGGDGGSDFWDIAAAHTLTGGLGDDEFSVLELVPGLWIDGVGGSNLLEGALAEGSLLRFDQFGTGQVVVDDLEAPPLPGVQVSNVDRMILFTERSVIDASRTDAPVEVELRIGTENTLYGSADDDILIGNGQVFGGEGNDTLFGTGDLSGGPGDDVLSGWGRLDGGPGDDVLVTRAVLGMDEPGTILTGGDGADLFDVQLTYLSGATASTDPARINDFSDADRLELTIFYDSQ